MINKQTTIKSKKLRDSARGQECYLRLDECNFNPETTVLCHLNGGGMGAKKSDLFASFGCSSCHAVMDGQVKTNYTYEFLELVHRQGVERTQQHWVDVGLIKV